MSLGKNAQIDGTWRWIELTPDEEKSIYDLTFAKNTKIMGDINNLPKQFDNLKPALMDAIGVKLFTERLNALDRKIHNMR